MNNLRTLRDRLERERNPGHHLGSFILQHSNSLEYLVSQLEGWLEAARADLAEEQAFAGRMLAGLRKRAEEAPCPHDSITVFGSDETGCRALRCTHCDQPMTRQVEDGEYVYYPLTEAGEKEVSHE